jgi:hypothetical protein
MDQPGIEAELKRLNKMLVTLSQMGIVALDPPPPAGWQQTVGATVAPPIEAKAAEEEDEEDEAEKPQSVGELARRLRIGNDFATISSSSAKPVSSKLAPPGVEAYEPVTAAATEKLQQLKIFRGVHPLYGLFLMDYLGKAEQHEIIQILESLLEMPGSVAKLVRVPWPDVLPPGRLALEVLDPAILTAGLATQDELYPPRDQSDIEPELRKYPIPLAQKMRLFFENSIDHAGGLFVTPVWAVGDLLAHGGDLDKFVRSRDMIKQEGILFKHVLRMILLCSEFAQLTPRDMDAEAWKSMLNGIAHVLTNACRAVDPQSTDQMLEELEEQA